MRRISNRIACVLALVALIAFPSFARADDYVAWERLAGEDRYQTSAIVAREGFRRSEWAVVATGSDFPDALSASGLAGTLDCPVVLTTPGRLCDEARSVLGALGVRKAYVVGGESVVSAAVVSDLAAMDVEAFRVAGADRVLTSIEAMRAGKDAGSASTSVVIASGKEFADALSIGPWAYKTGSPIVLVGQDGVLSDDAVASIRANGSVQNVLIVGGSNAVSPVVEDQLGEDFSFNRIYGDDRYLTSDAIARWAVDNGLSWERPAIVTGTNFPDALSAAALCGANSSVMLLVQEGFAPTIETIYEFRASVAGGYLVGGRDVLTMDNPTRDIGQTLADATPAQRLLVQSALETPFAGAGWCAAWVQEVYANAGHGRFYGNACDLYDQYCFSSNPANLKVGMIVAVSTHPHTYLGSIYGHVGIYMGDGWIRDNAQQLRTVPLSAWIDHYGASVPVRWGWLGNVNVA